MDFRILADGKDGKKKFFLEGEKFYVIPPTATHIHIYAGKLCFGICSYSGGKKTNRGKFFQIPKTLPGGKKVTAVCFPAYRHVESGYYYGEPEFSGPLMVPLKMVPC